MSIDVASEGSKGTALAFLDDPSAEVICIVVVREPRGALRVEDTTPGWSDMPYEQLSDEQLMYLGRS